MIDHLKGDYPVARLCQIWGCAPSSYYYRSQAAGDDPTVLAAIEAILMRWPFYGYRRIRAQLRREGIGVGERVVRRLLRQLAGSRQVGRVKVATTDSTHELPRYPNRIRNLEIKRCNQVWVADITYIRLGLRFMYLAVILDAHTRGVRGWQLSRQVDQELTITALQHALSLHLAPDIFHSDQGSQYAALRHVSLLQDAQVDISMSDTGQPTQNGLVERFIRTLKEEHVDYAEYLNFDDARQQLGHWLEVEYMTERIHSALDYLTPAEFEAVALTPSNSTLLTN